MCEWEKDVVETEANVQSKSQRPGKAELSLQSPRTTWVKQTCEADIA